MVILSGGQAYIVEDMSGTAPDGTAMPDYFDKGTTKPSTKH